MTKKIRETKDAIASVFAFIEATWKRSTPSHPATGVINATIAMTKIANHFEKIAAAVEDAE